MKCLTHEAMDKCQCEWCKMNRHIRDMQIKYMIGSEMKKRFGSEKQKMKLNISKNERRTKE